MGSVVENPILTANEENEDDSPSTTPRSERPMEPPKLLKSRPFGTRIEIVPKFVEQKFFCIIPFFLVYIIF